MQQCLTFGLFREAEAVPMFKRSMVILLVIAALAVGLTVYTLSQDAVALPLDRAEKAPAAMAPVTVYVTGAVEHPGVVTLTEGARVEQAVAACGGVLPTADVEAINLAKPLQDGVQIRVPEKAGLGGGMAAEAAKSGRVNINTADEKALDVLPGIGPAMAKRIIEYRMEHGAFQAPEDIKKVRGIGDAKYEKLKDQIVI